MNKKQKLSLTKNMSKIKTLGHRDSRNMAFLNCRDLKNTRDGMF